MKIKVTGIHGYGVDYGCLDSFSWFEQYECSLQDFGKIIYQILQTHPFTEYRIDYNTDTSIPHPKKDEDIVRPTCITNEDVEITG